MKTYYLLVLAILTIVSSELVAQQKTSVQVAFQITPQLTVIDSSDCCQLVEAGVTIVEQRATLNKLQKKISYSFPYPNVTSVLLDLYHQIDGKVTYLYTISPELDVTQVVDWYITPNLFVVPPYTHIRSGWVREILKNDQDKKNDGAGAFVLHSISTIQLPKTGVYILIARIMLEEEEYLFQSNILK
jgi:hypothetical protein